MTQSHNSALCVAVPCPGQGRGPGGPGRPECPTSQAGRALRCKQTKETGNTRNLGTSFGHRDSKEEQASGTWPWGFVNSSELPVSPPPLKNWKL